MKLALGTGLGMGLGIGLGIGLLLVLLGLGGCGDRTTQTPWLDAQVQRVVSGQTLEVTIPKLDPARIQQVRLIGIAAPELDQKPWGPEAQKFLQQQLESQRPSPSEKPIVQLEIDLQQQDPYQRLLAYVWLKGQLLNEVLVAQGQALASPRLPNLRHEERIQHAQEEARLMGRGIWEPSNAMRQTPAEFRKSF